MTASAPHHAAPAPLPASLDETALLDAFATTDATELTLCRDFGITLGQLESFLASPPIQASLAALERLKTIRAPLLKDTVHTAALRTFRIITSACPAAPPASTVSEVASSPAPGGGGVRAADRGGSSSAPSPANRRLHEASPASLHLYALDIRARESARKSAERMLKMLAPGGTPLRGVRRASAPPQLHARAEHLVTSSATRPESQPRRPSRHPDPPARPRPPDDALPSALRALYRARDARRARREGARVADPPA